MKPRTVTIHELRAASKAAPDEVTLSATVSKGTYIRSLARDIARALGHGRPRHHAEADARRAVRPRTGHFAGLSERSR